jgi:hypothetical protein
MEFILIKSSDYTGEYKRLERTLNAAPRLCPTEGPIRIYNQENTCFATPSIKLTYGDIITGWDGHGIFGETAFSSGAGFSLPADAATRYLSMLSGKGDQFIDDMRGVFAFIQFNQHTGEFSVALDPLSQYPLFVFNEGDTLIVSNNIYWIEAIATSFGYRMERTASAGAMEVLFGIGADAQTGFDKISLFPNDKILVGSKTSWTFKKAKHPDYKGLSYDHLLETAANRLTTYMKALDHATGGKDLLFDLTGGLDSRICFAAALSAKVQTPTIFSGGNDQDIDKLIAYDIAAHYGARVGNYPSNYDGQATTYTKEVQTAVFRGQGHSNLYHHDLGPLRLEGVCRVRGSAGEITRLFKSPPSKNQLFWARPMFHLKQTLSGNKIYSALLRSYFAGIFKKTKRRAVHWAHVYTMKPRALRGLFTHRFQTEAVTRIYHALTKPNGISNDIGMDLYVGDRTKRHFGYSSRALNMAYGVFEPLYDPVLLAAAETLPRHERATGKLSFDLIDKLGGAKLLARPYAPQSLGIKQRTYLARRLDIEPHDLVLVPEKLADVETAHITSANFRNIPAGNDDTPIPEHLGMHGTYLWQNRIYFREIIDSIPTDHACWSIFNMQNLKMAATDTGYFFESERCATHGLRIFHTLIWIAESEITAGIDAEFKTMFKASA